MIAPNVSLLAGSHPLLSSERMFEKDGKIVNLEYGTKINIEIMYGLVGILLL